MTVAEAKYSPDEHARRGKHWFEEKIVPRLSAKDDGKIVAIDIESGAFAIAEGTIDAAHQLRKHSPKAQIWFARVGSAGVHRFGSRIQISPE